MSDPIIHDATNPVTGPAHLVECPQHSWFKELTYSGLAHAEEVADRHRRTYHK